MSTQLTRDRGFDPRFNPAFQPGFDPAHHSGIPVVSDARQPQLLGVPMVVDPKHSPLASGTAAAGTAAQSSIAQISDGNSPLISAAADDIAHATEERARRRPARYLITLWVISVAFIGGGLSIVHYIGARLESFNTTGGGSGFDYYLLQIYTTAAPLLVVLGLATAVGTLYLLDVRKARH